jgi:peptide/nickel transport system substrate-binding protein
VRTPTGCLRYLFMNTTVAPFGDERVRAAVAKTIDRGAVAAASEGEATPAFAILPPTVDGHSSPSPPPGPDPAAAKQDLAAAGFAEGFDVRLVVGDGRREAAEAAAVASALGRAGVRVGVERVPIATLYENRYEVPGAKVPMGIATWCADWPGLAGRAALAPLVDPRPDAPHPVADYARFDSGGLDQMIDEAYGLADLTAARAAWTRADAEARRLAAVVPLASLTEDSLLGPRVRGFEPHPFFVRGDLTAIWLAVR